MNNETSLAVGARVDQRVGPHLAPNSWHWVQFETIDGKRTAPQPAQWCGHHWYTAGWRGIPPEGVIVCGPCVLPGKPVAWRVDGPCLSGRVGGDIWYRGPTADDVKCWFQLGIADRVTVQPLYALGDPVPAV